MVRAGISALLAHRDAPRRGGAETDAAFAEAMAARAIAEDTDAANAQHYEVPAAFFAKVLGPNRKYSSCFYRDPASTLQEAEEEALRQTVENADLADGRNSRTRLRLGFAVAVDGGAVSARAHRRRLQLAFAA